MGAVTGAMGAVTGGIGAATGAIGAVTGAAGDNCFVLISLTEVDEAPPAILLVQPQ